MKICRVEDLKENDILARPVMTDDYQILLSEGIILKREYIEKLKEFYIQEVFIKVIEICDDAEIFTLSKISETKIKTKIKEVLEHHVYNNSDELKELTKTADVIITEILNEKNLLEKVLDIKSRSADLYEHSANMCALAIILALKKGLSKNQVHDIGVGCLLHDLGLRYVTVDYINKDITELKESDRTEYKKHSIYGYSVVREEEWLSETSKNIILYHHEHKDGSGYPLKIVNMPLESQIAAVCDIFDEMNCGIGYTAKKVYETVEYLKTCAASFFDRDIIDIFLQFTAIYPVGSKVVTNEGDIAIIVKQNDCFPDRPVINIIEDKYGNETKENSHIDLLKMHHIFIDKVLN